MSLTVNAGFNFAGDGVKATATKNTTTNIDLKIAKSNVYVNGAQFVYKDSVWGDYIECQVIDIDNVLGGGANTVLVQYVTKWYLDPSSTKDTLISPYAGEVPLNTYMRLIYHSVGTSTDVSTMINYHLHQIG